VLVVTGKGERDSAGEQTPGVLRRSVPQWLRGAEYHSIVVGFEEASRPHGGTGALYVRLRRRDRVKQDRLG
jgi:DNA-nicking Smr family endonuclease